MKQKRKIKIIKKKFRRGKPQIETLTLWKINNCIERQRNS